MALGARFAHDAGSNRGDLTHLSNVGITRDRLFRGFGREMDELIRESFEDSVASVREGATRIASDPPRPLERLRSAEDPKQRWVDGTPLNSHYTWGIRLFFPEAKFIHLLRDPIKVINSLSRFDKIGGKPQNPVAAGRTWELHVRHARLAERAFGANQVLRVYHEDLIGDREQTLRTICDFVDEPFDANCLLPLQQKINSSGDDDGKDPDWYRRLSTELSGSRALFDKLRGSEGDVPTSPDEEAILELESLFNRLTFPKT